MLIKITVLTPKGQAAGAIESQKKALLGLRQAKKVKSQKLVSDSKFYWLLEIEPDKLKEISKKAIRGEGIIRKFYRMLMKTINRVNRLGQKFGKGVKWIKNQLVKRLKKMTGGGDDSKGFLNQIEGMGEEETFRFIKMNDEKAMTELLSKDLIKVEVIEK